MVVYIWYIATRQLCVVVNIQVKVWSCTLSYKNCHLTLLCHQHRLDTILTIFAKFEYYFDFDTFAIPLQPSRNEELCHFAILIEKYRVLRLLKLVQEISKQLKVFPCFSVPIFFYFSILWKEVHQQLITYHKLTELILIPCLINARKIVTFEVVLFPILSLEYVISI